MARFSCTLLIVPILNGSIAAPVTATVINRQPPVVGLLLLVCALVVHLPAATAPRIVAFGDSLTSGRGIGRDAAYPAVLQDRLTREGYDYQVVNAGLSGDTTSRALRRLRGALDGDVRVLIVALGANDGLRGVSVDQLKSNLGKIIEEAQQRKIDVVLVGMDALPIHGLPYSIAFHKAYEELAAEHRITLVRSVLPRVMLDRSLMQPDGVHPNDEGARVIANAIWPSLEPLLKRVA